MKRIVKLLIFLVLSIVLVAGIYLLMAFVLARIPVKGVSGESKEVTIYILSNGVHTDLVLPLRNHQMDWSRDVRFENTIGKDTSARYIAMGWGDKGFYLETPTWGDLTFRVAYRAVLGLGSTAIHATFYRTITEGDRCRKIEISDEQYAHLISYIRNTFQTNASGSFIPIKTNANYGNDDAFYEAKGSYSLFRTCNVWTNTGLKRCGQKAGLWTPFDKGIFYHYRQKQNTGSK